MKRSLLCALALLCGQALFAQSGADDFEITETLKLSGKISPTQITSDQNNYAPTSFADSTIIRLSTDASRTITGLAGGADGRYIVIANVGSFNVVLAAESASSTAANRFALSSALTIIPKGSVALVYDGTSSRWRLLVPNAAGTENPLSFVSPLIRTVDSIAMAAATSSVPGYLLSADWVTFNAKAAGDATYITQTASSGLSAEQALGLLATGIVKNTTTTGVLSIAVAGTDYLAVPGSSAEGDILYRDASGWTRLAKGADGTVLKSTTTTINWGTDSTGAGGLPATPAEGDIAYFDGADWVSLGIGTPGQSLIVNGTGDAPIYGDAANAGTLTLARFTARDNQPPASNFARLDTRNSIFVLDFNGNNSTNESAVFAGIVPEGADFTTGLTVRLVYTATSATSGDTIWTFAFERGNTDLDSDSFATGLDTAASTTNGTSGIVTVTTKDFSGSEIDGLVAGDLFRLKVTRNTVSASDTMTGDAELIAVEIQQR